MSKKVIEKHITVTEDIHIKLSMIAKKKRKSMRKVVSRLIEGKYKEVIDGRE